MAIITPTITTDDPHEYRDQMELISSYAQGVHLDFSDGVFTPTRLLSISKAWRREDIITHAHVMYKNPLAQIKQIVKLGADLVILHAESENVGKCLEELSEKGLRVGIALLPGTPTGVLDKYPGLFDHVLVFGGHLGYQGGEADLSLLSKVVEIKSKYPDIEISWDGGVNAENAAEIAQAGVSILNTGGSLKNAQDPKSAYALLSSLIQS